MKKTTVYQKKYIKIAENISLKEAKNLIKEVKELEEINTYKDFKIEEN